METLIAFLLTYVATCYGTVLWMTAHLVATKDDYDDKNEGFPWLEYKRKNWDNWLLAVVGIPFIAHFGPEATALVFPDLAWSQMGYALSGFIIQALYSGWKKYRSK